MTLSQSTPHTDESQRGEWQQHWYGLFLPLPHLISFTWIDISIWNTFGEEKGFRWGQDADASQVSLWLLIIFESFCTALTMTHCHLPYLKWHKEESEIPEKNITVLHDRANFHLFLPFHGIWRGLFFNTSLDFLKILQYLGRGDFISPKY